MRRSARASTFAASLELAREGKIELRQETAFAPIWLRSTEINPDEERAA
jgi:segregation and condensation protein A